MEIKCLGVVFSPGIEPGTFRVSGRCDNSYTDKQPIGPSLIELFQSNLVGLSTEEPLLSCQLLDLFHDFRPKF